MADTNCHRCIRCLTLSIQRVLCHYSARNWFIWCFNFCRINFTSFCLGKKKNQVFHFHFKESIYECYTYWENKNNFFNLSHGTLALPTSLCDPFSMNLIFVANFKAHKPWGFTYIDLSFFLSDPLSLLRKMKGSYIT